MSKKKCTKCGVEKNLSDFHKRKDGFQFRCKQCQKEIYESEYSEKLKAERKTNPERFKNKHLKYYYGITIEEYKKLHKQQNGKCPGCGLKIGMKTNSKNIGMVDHSHKTGAVRGLLCVKCNFALGYVNDNIQVLDNLKEYLNGKK